MALAKREILSAADHFSQIRASRKSNINSTLAFGQLMANTPGQTTVQVRVPYRVVGLVVGPKGATIKRIQQQTHTYIVTPSRDKEPVFEVTGLPENVEAARKEIEAHIAIRTGTTDFGPGIFFEFDLYLKMAFFRTEICFSDLKKILIQITILSLKFEIPAHNSKQLIQISSSG